MKGKFIAELVPGQPFGGSTFAIRGVARKQTSNGSEYLTCTLSDRSGSVRATMWSPTDEQCQVACTSKLVRVKGEMQMGEFAGNVLVKAFESVKAPADLTDYLQPIPENHERQQQRFQEQIAKIEHPHLCQLLEKIFDPESERWQAFCTAVGATRLHHAYRGGLLDHTLEVARLCLMTCHVVRSLRRDFLVTCALLHDIGKLEEMDHGLACGEYSAVGNLIGHTVLGMQLVASACDAIDGFPTDLKHGIMHLILSHHGKPEFGAAKPPLCAEAQVLSSNDLLSARLDQCNRASFSALDGGHTAPIWGWDSKFIHVGDFGLVPREEA